MTKTIVAIRKKQGKLETSLIKARWNTKSCDIVWYARKTGSDQCVSLRRKNEKHGRARAENTRDFSRTWPNRAVSRPTKRTNSTYVPRCNSVGQETTRTTPTTTKLPTSAKAHRLTEVSIGASSGMNWANTAGTLRSWGGSSKLTLTWFY